MWYEVHLYDARHPRKEKNDLIIARFKNQVDAEQVEAEVMNEVERRNASSDLNKYKHLKSSVIKNAFVLYDSYQDYAENGDKMSDADYDRMLPE